MGEGWFGSEHKAFEGEVAAKLSEALGCAKYSRSALLFGCVERCRYNQKEKVISSKKHTASQMRLTQDLFNPVTGISLGCWSWIEVAQGFAEQAVNIRHTALGLFGQH